MPAPSVPQYFSSPDPAVSALPFSEAVQVGDLLFLSGQIGNVPGTLDLVPGGVAAESRQVMENIRAILERHGSSLDQVVKCTVFLADMQDWPAFNAIYRTYFAGHFPARSALGANGLARGARVEVECIAAVPGRSQ
ncbi:MAG: Rid family detoxifying hydrolase [Gemmatimonadota bacterium]